MRTATATIIVLALSSLSCDVFQRGHTAETLAGSDAISTKQAPEQVQEEAVAFQNPGPEETATLDAAMQARILTELKARHTALSERELHRLASTIVAEAGRYELDPTLVMAVIRVESGGNHLAVSPVGALGLMQLLPSTAEELATDLELPWRGPNSLFDPILNVKLGTAYLSQLSVKYGSVSKALAAYNWGPGRIDRRLRRGGSLPRIYIEQVMKFYDAGSKVALASSS